MNYSQDVAEMIDAEVRRIVTTAHKRATDIKTHIDKLHAVSKRLMEKETIDAAEFQGRWRSANGSVRVHSSVSTASPSPPPRPPRTHRPIERHRLVVARTNLQVDLPGSRPRASAPRPPPASPG
ncbi:MAG: hypothetical protein IPG72_14480 [Ardenticatenales bacterium]|nr:hypothetical protein [Ardenticatenales bacterium]